MGGKACIRGMRVTAGTIVGQIGSGQAIEEILADYPWLEREDILQALRYAAWRMEEREVINQSISRFTHSLHVPHRAYPLHF